MMGMETILDADSNIAITNQLLVEDQLILIQNKGQFTIYEIKSEKSEAAHVDEYEDD